MLGRFVDADRAAAVCSVFKNINELRKGYPTHVNNTDKFLPAHDFLRVSYPIDNFEAAWDAILGKYFRAMKDMRDILAEERKKKTS